MGGTFVPGGGSLQNVDPLIMTQFLQRNVPGLSDYQQQAGDIAGLGLGSTKAEDEMRNVIARSTGRTANLLDQYGAQQGVTTDRRRGFQDEYGGLTQGKGEAMTNRFVGGGADAQRGFKGPDVGGYNPFAGGGKGGGGGGGSYNFSGGGGGPSGASAEAVAEAKRFQDVFGKKNADQEKSLKLYEEGRGEAQAFNRAMQGDNKYDKQAQDVYKKYEGIMSGRHEMDAKTAGLFDQLQGQMQGNQYEQEATDLVRKTTGDVMIDETTPQIQAAKKLFDITQGSKLTNQMAAAGLGRGAARADVEGRAWATQLPSLLQNEQQQEMQERAAQREAAGQLQNMGQQASQRALQTFGAGQAANADIASRERGLQQDLMRQGIGLNTQQSQQMRENQRTGYQAQAQALQAQAQAAMAAGDSEKARELNAQSNLMNAFSMRSGSEDAAAARGASAAAQAAGLQAQMEQARMGLYGQMYGTQADLYNSAEDRALRAMQGELGSLENMFSKLDASEQGIAADQLAALTGQGNLIQGMMTGANAGLANIAGNERAGQQNAFNNLMNIGGVQQQTMMDQFNYDTSEIERLRQLWAGTMEGSTAFSPAPFLQTKTSGGGKKS